MADATSFILSGVQTVQPAETREPSRHLTFFSLPALFQKKSEEDTSARGKSATFEDVFGNRL